MDKEIRNIQAVISLKEVVERIQKKREHILSFSPRIIYKHAGIEDEERLTVRIQILDFYAGDINIEEGTFISSATHHLNFSAKWQDYTYNEATNIFSITGHSLKMGNYEVQFLIDENI